MSGSTRNFIRFLLLLGCCLLTACSDNQKSPTSSEKPVSGTSSDIPDTNSFLGFAVEEPNTLDPQCTSSYYTVPLNVFDRLVEVKVDNGESDIVPALAESWEISGDALVYNFHLRKDVTFSDGSPLTSGDVKFTFERLLTNPKSRNQDIVMSISGAQELRSGTEKELTVFRIIDDHNFEINQ